jgi:hypothetical protein
MRIVVINHVTLDGVMQGPGRPDEDTRDGFTHGGWAAERAGDDVIMKAVGERLAASGGLLLGSPHLPRHSGLLEHPGQPIPRRPQQCPQVRRLQRPDRAPAVAQLDAAQR